MSDPRTNEPSEETRAWVDALLEQDRLTLDEAPAPLVDAIWEQVAEETVDHKTNLRERLRQLASPARIAIASFAMIGIGASFLAMSGLRPDLDAGSTAWLATVHAIVLLGSVGGLALALRPNHLPPLNLLAWLGVGSVLLMPIAIALVPGLLPGMTGHPPTVAHVMCAANGLFMALPATAVVLLLDRSRNPASWRVLLAAGAAGMSAFGMGAWHCPSVDPFHLIVAHAGLGAVLGLVVLGVVRLWGWVRG